MKLVYTNSDGTSTSMTLRSAVTDQSLFIDAAAFTSGKISIIQPLNAAEFFGSTSSSIDKCPSYEFPKIVGTSDSTKVAVLIDDMTLAAYNDEKCGFVPLVTSVKEKFAAANPDIELAMVIISEPECGSANAGDMPWKMFCDTLHKIVTDFGVSHAITDGYDRILEVAEQELPAGKKFTIPVMIASRAQAYSLRKGIYPLVSLKETTEGLQGTSLMYNASSVTEIIMSTKITLENKGINPFFAGETGIAFAKKLDAAKIVLKSFPFCEETCSDEECSESKCDRESNCCVTDAKDKPMMMEGIKRAVYSFYKQFQWKSNEQLVTYMNDVAACFSKDSFDEACAGTLLTAAQADMKTILGGEASNSFSYSVAINDGNANNNYLDEMIFSTQQDFSSIMSIDNAIVAKSASADQSEVSSLLKTLVATKAAKFSTAADSSPDNTVTSDDILVRYGNGFMFIMFFAFVVAGVLYVIGIKRKTTKAPKAEMIGLNEENNVYNPVKVVHLA